MLLKCLWNLILICDDIFSFNLSYVITSNHAFICHEEFNKIPKLIFSFDAFFWNFIHISSYFSFLIWRTYFSVFIFFICCFLFCSWFNPVFISSSTSHTNVFFKLSVNERCIVTPYKFLFQRSMFVNDTEELISQKVVVLIRVVFEKVKICFLRLRKKLFSFNFDEHAFQKASFWVN